MAAMRWSLKTRMTVYFAVFLAIAVSLTVSAMAWNAKQNLIEQVERDISLLARVLSKSVSVSRTLPDQVEGIAGQGMIATAWAISELVAIAERHGESPTEIKKTLGRLVSRFDDSEIWVTDSSGRAYLNAPLDIDFQFSPDPAEQPQASKFWPLLTGEQASVIQSTREREIDKRLFKYAGVGGVDRPRIVQVGVEGKDIVSIREAVGVERLANSLVGSGALRAMYVVNHDLSPVFTQRTFEAAGETISDRQRSVLARVMQQNIMHTEIRPYAIQVYHPIRDEDNESLGGFVVQVPRAGIDELLADQVRAAIAIGVAVFLVGGFLSFRFADWLTGPIARVTSVAAELQRGKFDSLGRLDEPARRIDEIGQLATVFRQMADEVRSREQVLDGLVSQRTAELAEKNSALEKSQALVNSELELARRLQLAILPARFPLIPGWTGFARMLPATHMGGDFYDFIELPDGRFAAVIADVSGKGVAAAFFMAVARTSINSLVRSMSQEPGRCLAAANAEICAQNPLDLFVTAFLGVFDPASGSLRFANAGHNPPLVRRADTGQVEALATSSELALGVMDGFDYGCSELRLNPGDEILLYTDGVTEAFNAGGQMFGMDRLGYSLEATQVPPQERVESVFIGVTGFAAGHPQSDDITVAVLRREA
jgi:sigma-B regulation protein RsbU (phosphoserine phosphatase)